MSADLNLKNGEGHDDGQRHDPVQDARRQWPLAGWRGLHQTFEYADRLAKLGDQGLVQRLPLPWPGATQDLLAMADDQVTVDPEARDDVEPAGGQADMGLDLQMVCVADGCPERGEAAAPVPLVCFDWTLADQHDTQAFRLCERPDLGGKTRGIEVDVGHQHQQSLDDGLGRRLD